MLKKLFSKRADDIDRLIFEIAEHKRDADLRRFINLIPGREFFCPVDKASTASLPHGKPYTVQAEDAAKIPFLAQLQGRRFLPLFTSETDKRLRGGCFAVEGVEALKMALKMEAVDGVLFQNNERSWLCMEKEQIRESLKTLDMEVTL